MAVGASRSGTETARRGSGPCLGPPPRRPKEPPPPHQAATTSSPSKRSAAACHTSRRAGRHPRRRRLHQTTRAGAAPPAVEVAPGRYHRCEHAKGCAVSTPMLELRAATPDAQRGALTGSRRPAPPPPRGLRPTTPSGGGETEGEGRGEVGEECRHGLPAARGSGARALSRMNRQWMYIERRFDEFTSGLENFIAVAEANKHGGFIYCPCVDCKNIVNYAHSSVIHSHLLPKGFMPSYYCWTKHGERGVMMEDNKEEEEDDDGYPNFPEYDDTGEGNEDNEVEDQEAQMSLLMMILVGPLMQGENVTEKERSNVDPNNVPLASLVAQEENVDVNFIKNNNFNNNAYRNNSGNNYRPYPSANGNGYGNSYGNSYNNNRSVPSSLEAMLKEFISTQTAFNKSVEEKLDKIDTIASRVDRLASDVNLLKLKVMPNNDIDNKITTTANAIQVRINENIRLMAELRARWDREENEKLAKENNIAKVWTITTTSNANYPRVAAPPTINGKIIGVGNVSTPSAKRTKLPEIAKTAETACDKAAEIFSNLGNNDPIAVAHNDLDFDDCHISEVIKFLQKLAKSPNASAINLAFTKHITNALIKAREEKLKLETSIPRKLEDGWEPIIKMKFNDFECNALCDLGASISVMPKKIYDMLDLPPLKNCYLDVNLADNVKKKTFGED
ncbi:hypothetical protein QYE76_064970 [Lolium multiflorum]|uniref:Transposase-associated domain-containing protein n=1 Tax=Lolium multiflorum TaxID=4521 RepID=A0AAD8W9K8_LOLMU|nr:hypothetical protein QYE76_064970 [Lolium multiflorum]